MGAGRLVRDRRRRERLPAVCMIGCDLHPAFPRYLRRGLATGVRQLNGNLHVGPAADAFHIGQVLPASVASFQSPTSA